MEEEQLDQRIAEGESLLHTGSASEAEAMFRSLLGSLKEETWEDGYRLIRVLDGLGASCLVLGKLDEAEFWLRGAARFVEGWLSGTDIWMAHVMCHLAEVRAKQRQDEEAIGLLDRALAICDELGERAMYLRPSIRFSKADLYRAQGDSERALTETRRSVDEAKSIGHSRGMVCDTLLALGDLAFDLDDFSLAEDAYREGLSCASLKHCLSTEVSLLLNLGACLDKLGRQDEAIRCDEQALALADSPGSAIDPSLRAMALRNLGSILTEVDGEEERGYQALESALALLDASRSPVGYATVLTEMGGVKRRRGLIEEAVALCQRSVSLLEESGYGVSSDMADAKHELAYALLKKGCIQEAEHHVLDQLRIRQTVQSRTHLDYARGLYLLGRILSASGRYKQAALSILDGMVIVKNTLGADSKPYQIGVDELREVSELKSKAPAEDETQSTSKTVTPPRYLVSLRLSGAELDPDKVSEQLQVGHTGCTRKGEVNKQGQVSTEASWEYEVEGRTEESFDSVVKRLLEFTLGLGARFAAARENAEARVRCEVWFLTPNANVHLETDTMSLATKLALPVDISAYLQQSDMSVYETEAPSEYLVSLRLSGPDVDPDKVSEQLQVECSSSARRCKSKRPGVGRDEGFWDYDVEQRTGELFDSAVKRLLAFAAGLGERLDTVRKSADACVRCGVWFPTSQEHLRLDTDTMSQATKLRLPVYICLYPQWKDISVYE